ncbi:ComEC/Rec2 family competence protein [Brevibacillus dissolubilis]|uniref:ComEC/Rec2 family competence protein n=1 Tax=Brevibacillus dissolubilis TaxID=1844116 RepID=UPI0021004FAD|nr:MBL fold metallo-hydrolase [Brevibacillus dissolubilis]
MRIRVRTLSLFLLVISLIWVLAGCSSIDDHLAEEPDLGTVKVEDPFQIKDEREFLGMVTTYFDLPHGESTLVRMPGGKKLLIDTGSAQDTEVLLERLQDRRVTKIDFVILTNDQAEQTGGFLALAEKMQIDTVILPKAYSAAIRRVIPFPRGQKLMYLTESDQVRLDDKVQMTVFHPGEDLFLSPQDNSLVFQLKHDKLRFLFTSAISDKVEERLLGRYAELLTSEVLKVPDQGSNQASSQQFLTQVDAQVAIVMTGKNRESMKSTQAEVLERLGESWAETYITGQDGTITILSNGNQYRVLKKR